MTSARPDDTPSTLASTPASTLPSTLASIPRTTPAEPTRRTRRTAADRAATRTVHAARRRVFDPAIVAVGAVFGALALTGVTTASASAAVPDSLTTHAVVAASALPAAANAAANASLSDIADEAQAALDAARIAVAAAEQVTVDITASGLDVGLADTTIDTTELEGQISRLARMDVLPILLLPGVTEKTTTATDDVVAQTAALRQALDAAIQRKAEADAAAEAQRQAEAAAAALAAANTPDGAKATARAMLADYGWGDDQFSCLESLWNRESGWDYEAYNSGSGATGIPQALPGSKMASAGSDWQTNAATQIRWGLGYIAGSYGTPCAAWGHSQSTGWY